MVLRRVRSVLHARLGAAAVDHYMSHLYPVPGQEIMPLTDVLPGSTEPPDAVGEFQVNLIKKMAELQSPLIGWKVTPPTYELVKFLRPTEEICTPLFVGTRMFNGAAIEGVKAQHVSAGIVLELDASADDITPERVDTIVTAFYPAIEILGSRFPYYPPNVNNFVCDQASHARFVLGSPVPLDRVHSGLSQHGFVLLCDDVPVQVGFGKYCLSNPLNAAVSAVRYAKSLNIPVPARTLVLCSGVCGRVQAKNAKYDVNFGPYGSVSCTLKL